MIFGDRTEFFRIYPPCMGYYTEFLRSPLDIIRAQSLSLPRSLILKHTWSKAYLSLLIEYVLISPQRSLLLDEQAIAIYRYR